MLPLVICLDMICIIMCSTHRIDFSNASLGVILFLTRRLHSVVSVQIPALRLKKSTEKN